MIALIAFALPKPSTATKEEQFVYVTARGEQMVTLVERISDSTGISEWNHPGPIGPFGAPRCRDGREPFKLTIDRSTSNEPDVYLDGEQLSRITESIEDTLLAEGFEVERDDTNRRLGASRADMFIKFNVRDHGSAGLYLESTCSDTWPNFDLTSSEYIAMKLKQEATNHPSPPST